MLIINIYIYKYTYLFIHIFLYYIYRARNTIMTSMTTVEPWYRNTCYAWVSKGGSGKRIPINQICLPKIKVQTTLGLENSMFAPKPKARVMFYSWDRPMGM